MKILIRAERKWTIPFYNNSEFQIYDKYFNKNIQLQNNEGKDIW